MEERGRAATASASSSLDWPHSSNRSCRSKRPPHSQSAAHSRLAPVSGGRGKCSRSSCEWPPRSRAVPHHIAVLQHTTLHTPRHRHRLIRLVHSCRTRDMGQRVESSDGGIAHNKQPESSSRERRTQAGRGGEVGSRSSRLSSRTPQAQLKQVQQQTLGPRTTEHYLQNHYHTPESRLQTPESRLHPKTTDSVRSQYGATCWVSIRMHWTSIPAHPV